MANALDSDSNEREFKSLRADQSLTIAYTMVRLFLFFMNFLMIAKTSTHIKPLTVFKIISFISSAPVAKISITIWIKTKNEIFLCLLFFLFIHYELL